MKRSSTDCWHPTTVNDGGGTDDIWRYSDWFGLGEQLRYSQKHIWHWRDWIVESLNKDRAMIK